MTYEQEAHKAWQFVGHIQQHLKPGEVVICKICGKTIDDIYGGNNDTKGQSHF